MVLIDTAPLLATVDTHSILPHVANVLFVVKAEHTKICDIQDSLDQLGDKTLGVILNKIRHLKHEQHYYSYQ
jgi:Mrp family chromosome partitioning ATPase